MLTTQQLTIGGNNIIIGKNKKDGLLRPVLFYCVCCLSYEKQLAIFRESPKAVFHNHLEMVYLVAYGLHLWLYGIVIAYGTAVDVVNAVSYAARLGELVNESLYALGALRYLLYQFHVASTEAVSLVGIENRLHRLHVAYELALIVSGDGNDVVHG